MEAAAHLAGTVGAAQAVATALLEAQAGVVEQDLGTIGEGELAVAEVNALFRLDLIVGLLLGHLV